MGEQHMFPDDPVTGDSLFEAALMTKPALGYNIMKLVHERRIALDGRL
jgi:CubicO group peptidase (beta-lactamase class C family)